MDATAAADALVEWVKATIPAIKGTYDHDPSEKTQPLPDVAASISAEEVTDRDPDTELQIEQADLHIMRATLLLMVPPEPAGEATETLQDFVAALGASIAEDQTLGGRLPAVSRRWSASYEPPYVQFEDGTEGRAVYFSLVIAELDT